MCTTLLLECKLDAFKSLEYFCFVQNALRDLNRMRKRVAHPVLPDFIKAKTETETAPSVRRTRIQTGKPEAPNVVSASSIFYVNDLIYFSGKIVRSFINL